MTFNAVSVAISKAGGLVNSPSPKALLEASSVHVFAFSSKGQLLLAESEGPFTMDAWNEAHDEAQQICCEAPAGQMETAMDEDGKSQNLQAFMQQTIGDQVERSRRWKAAS